MNIHESEVSDEYLFRLAVNDRGEMPTLIIDLEANGLLDTVTKVHCICGKVLGTDNVMLMDVNHLHKYGTLIGHNLWGYDLAVLEKLYGFKYTGQVIDTLAMSREWWPDRPEGHSLESWAKQLEGRKPVITDWENESIEVYVDRCTEDVLTTEKVFNYLCNKI